MICQLQETFDDEKDYHTAKLTQIKKQKLLSLRRDNLKSLAELQEKWIDRDRYYSAVTLPKDCVLIVRNSALKDFEQLLSDNENTTSSCSQGNTSQVELVKESLTENERTTVLKLILAMAVHSYDYD
ncbi:MAG: hypothetical protein IPN42_06585 [Methylococcaceae bacterium]|nr:hypothetical protein [Methylococcaceae bacterium]